MKNESIKNYTIGLLLFVFFIGWTLLVSYVDVRPIGPNGTPVGFARVNQWFHNLSGVHMTVYNITDILGFVPFLICIFFGCVGLKQLIERKSLKKVDTDIVILGIYYILVICGYIFFEKFPVNFRPVLIDGRMEASYPSSTTLLVLSVMPSLSYQANRRIKKEKAKHVICFFSGLFAGLMTGARLLSGVHWLTDIIGGCLLSAALFSLYSATVKRCTSL